MPNRTPSFIVVGLVIVICLLVSFYMSCSSSTIEIRHVLDDLEERVRKLTLKNADSERTIESLTSRKLELRKEKLELQKQLNNKDLEIKNLSTTSNEKFANKDLEIHDLNRTLNEKLANKDLEIKDLTRTSNEKLANKDFEIKDLTRTSNEKLAKIQKQLETKDLEVKDLNKKLNEKIDVRQELEEKDSEINDLHKKLNEKYGDIHRLNVDKEVIDEKLDNLNKELKNNREILASKTSQIGNLQRDLYEQKQSKDGQINQLKQEIDIYKAALNNSRYYQEKAFQNSLQPVSSLLADNETLQNSSSLLQLPSVENKGKISNMFVHGMDNDTQQFNRGKPALMPSENGTAGQQRNVSELSQSIQLASDNKLSNNTQLNAEHAPIPIDLVLLSRVNKTNIANNKSQLSAADKNYRRRNRQIRKPSN